jgi:hypothetical protein
MIDLQAASVGVIALGIVIAAVGFPGTVVFRRRGLLIVGSLGAVVTLLGVVSLLFSHLLGL